MYYVGIVGCGKIFKRHVEAINKSENYKLVAVCDNNLEKLNDTHTLIDDEVLKFSNYKDMINNDKLNFVVIATPNVLHFEQSKYFLENNCDVLIEKPATINPKKCRLLQDIADKNSQSVYAVLQVRLNHTVQKIKNLIDKQKIGKIIGISLCQRWQRPFEYFDDWRGIPEVGGGTLHECGIHYLDIICYLFGKPDVKFSKLYNRKHKDKNIEDTIISFIEFDEFHGTVEVSIACEPSNIECSLTIMTDKGFIKVGGKALDKIVSYDFKNYEIEKFVKNEKSEITKPNDYEGYKGSCPNHPELYKNIENFPLSCTQDVLDLIDEIYKASDRKYY